MTESNSSEKKITLSDLAARFSVAFTDVQQIVLHKRLIDGDTYDSIGGLLSVANARVRHIENTSFEKLTKQFLPEIEYFAIELERMLSEAGGTLTVNECLKTFPEITETEFVILFAACQLNRKGLFHRTNEIVCGNSICSVCK